MARRIWPTARVASALAAALSLATVGAAGAQDLDGGYVGIYGAGVTGTGLLDDGMAAGAYGGYRFEVTGNTYLGAEADILVPSGTSDAVAAGFGTLGYEFLPDTLVYGRAGLAVDTASNGFWVAGAGLDVGVGNGISLRFGGDRYDGLNGATEDWVAKAGIALSF